MCCKNSILKLTVLGISLVLGLAAAAFFAPPDPSLNWDDALTAVRNSGDGKDSGPDSASGRAGSVSSDPANVPLSIISKPKAAYTDEARTNDTQGVVTLRITFLASGEIGGITVVSGLPDGLTEQAIAAAKQIKFEPKRVGGQPVSVTMTFQYGFNIY
jgi:TonB family protein